MTARVIRLGAGLVAGGMTVLAIDRLLWPGTLADGMVGVVAAGAVLWLTTARSEG